MEKQNHTTDLEGKLDHTAHGGGNRKKVSIDRNSSNTEEDDVIQIKAKSKY